MTEVVDKKIELLAPAGSFDSLKAAVINGADAVYLGASAFSARFKADNFDAESLAKAVNYCHLFGVKVYLAVNTLIKPKEYDDAIQTIFTAKNAGVDAFIIQDLAFLSVLHSTMSDIIVHLSTQAGIHNLSGAVVAQQIGASRIILARETLLSDIKEIKKNTELEIEYFVQGALCVAFSGNCYFSSLAASLSGNRGKCLQFCRKQYEHNNRKGYFLSAKDLNLSGKIDELIDAGVTSFKIEGRMRRAEYVAESVKYYRELLNKNHYSDENLKKLFNRGDYCAAYLNNPTDNVIYPRIQGHKGVKIGTVKSVNGKKAVLSLNKPLHAGDGIKFIRHDAESGSAVAQEDGFSVYYSGKVKSGDDVNITTDKQLSVEINARERKLPVTVTVRITQDGKIQAQAQQASNKAVLESDFLLEYAKNAPITQDSLFEIFDKTGDFEFKLQIFSARIHGNFFAPKSQLNDFRRKLYTVLSNTILTNYEKSVDKCFNSNYNFDLLIKNLNKTPDNIKTIIQTNQPESLSEFFDLFDSIAFCPQKYDENTPNIVSKTEQQLQKPVFLSLPIITRGKDNKILGEILSDNRIKNVIINNIGQIYSAKDKNILFGPMMNIINPDIPVTAVMSPEYEGKEYGGNFIYAFGKFPLMTFAHCPRKTVNNGTCQNCNHEPMSYADEQHNEFTIRFQKIHYCYAQMSNCVPIDVITRFKTPTDKRFIDLIGYDAKEIREILSALRTGQELGANFTRGYLNKKLQ